MKAVIVKDVGVLEVQDLPEPEPQSDQIKIKIAYAGICGSDPKVVDRKGGRAPLNGAIGWPPKSAPAGAGTKILGHEASGTIVKIGKDVKGNFKVGQRVAVNYRNTCGACYYCTNGMEHFCENVNSIPGIDGRLCTNEREHRFSVTGRFTSGCRRISGTAGGSRTYV